MLLQTTEYMRKSQSKQQLIPQVMTCVQQNRRRYFRMMLHQFHLNYILRFQMDIFEKFTQDLAFLQSIL